MFALLCTIGNKQYTEQLIIDEQLIIKDELHED